MPSTGERQVSEEVGSKRIASVSEFERLRAEVRAKHDATKTWISVCGGTSCSASEARPVREALQEAIAKNRLKKKVGLKLTGCHGFCEHGPLVVVSPEGICYERVKPEDAAEIIEKTVLEHEVIERLLYVDPSTSEKVQLEKDIPFLDSIIERQRRVEDMLGREMDEDADAVNGEPSDVYEGAFLVASVASTILPTSKDFETGDIDTLPAHWSFAATTGTVQVADTDLPHNGAYHLKMEQDVFP